MMSHAQASAAAPYSLRRQLVWLLLIAVASTAIVQGVVSYYAASQEANEIFDYHMRQIALALRDGAPAMSSQSPAEESSFDFVIQVWSRDHSSPIPSDPKEALPQQAAPGFAELIAHGTRYRVFSLQTPTQTIQIAQDMAARRELAASLALRLVGPVMLLAPVLMLAVWWVVTRSTRPLLRAREQIARRAADELSPLVVSGLPDEVRPLVDEINLLFGRLAEAFDAQRNFVADAAHELRSPLAALRLQVQSMQRAGDVEARAVAAGRLLAGIDRSAHLVDQMLALARQEATDRPIHEDGVDLPTIAALAIGDVLRAAQQRRIDIGVVESAAASVPGEAEALRILFRNLLENAIKFAPVNGTVDVAIRVASGRAVVEIADDGPGIPVQHRERVFDRFFRVSDGDVGGSGLGLAIARSIARRHRAAITLDTSTRLGGLLVTVRFEAANP